MRIFNIITNRVLGGAEQAFLDYEKALSKNGHEVINITSSFALLNSKTKSIKLPNLTPWCIISKIYLKILIFLYKPDLIITHCRRPLKFLRAFWKNSVPIVGVSHGYATKYILECDYIIALNESLKNHFIKHGYDSSKIFIIPNMIDISAEKKISFDNKSEYVIGSMGRFSEEKGFFYLIHAIKILKDKKYNVKLKIGGEGPLEKLLRNEVSKLKIHDKVEFLGWVDNKEEFFQNIDISILPSIIESFGIAALDAMARGMPIIATDTDGFSNIFTNEENAIIVPKANAQAIADAALHLIQNPSIAKKIAKNGYREAKEKYDRENVAKNLSSVIENILS